jgi:hypothetical protein
MTRPGTISAVAPIGPRLDHAQALPDRLHALATMADRR